MKLTFGIITLNADFFIRQVLESIYPFAHKIIIADGAVKWWADNHGLIGSMDKTIRIIKDFQLKNDPDYKIILVQNNYPYTEKDDQCRAWFQFVPADTDYVICNDADEVHSPENLEKLIKFLEKEQPTSVGFKSDSFFGGFDRIIGGFERDHNFKRVLKYEAGCYYHTHRQPTLLMPDGKPPLGGLGVDITGNQLYEQTGITMWHGSYVSPIGVYNKIKYYEGAVISKGNCIPNYFNDLWLPWVRGNTIQRDAIEQRWKGVQEFMPHARGECFTQPYTGTHPPAIQESMQELKNKFDNELKEFV